VEYTPGDAYPYRAYPYESAFNPMPDDTVELFGVRACTLLVNGTVDTVARDSVVMRTVALPETVIEVNGMSYGRARFERPDFSYAGGVYSDIMSVVNNDTGGFATELIRGHLGRASLEQMAGVFSFGELSEPLKDSLVAAFNSIKDTLGFVEKHNAILKPIVGRPGDTSRTFAEVLDRSYKTVQAFKEFMYLRARGVFVDDEGTLKGGTCTFSEQQSVEWLNILLLTTAVFRDAFLVRDVLTRRISPRRTTLGPLGSTGEEQWIVRYFERSDSVYYQRAYEDAGGVHAVAESLVWDCRIMSNLQHAVSLMFWDPMEGVVYGKGSVVGPVGKAVFRNAANPGEVKDFRWDLYYSSYGTIMIGDVLAHVQGSLVLLQSISHLHGSNTVTKQDIRSVLRIAPHGGAESTQTTHIQVEALE